MVINQISSDKIIATHLLYNRAKRTDININEANTIELTTSAYTVYDTLWTVKTAIPKGSVFL
jgi:hypothetical protein